MNERFLVWRGRADHLRQQTVDTAQGLLQFKSLSSQFALMAITATIGVIAILVLLSSLSVNITSSSALHNDLAREAKEFSSTLSANATNATVYPGRGVGTNPGEGRAWFLGDPNNVVAVLPPNGIPQIITPRGGFLFNAQNGDATTIVAALHHVVATNQPQQGDLQDLAGTRGAGWLWVHFATRAYAATPYYTDAAHTQIGAVIVFSRPTVETASEFAYVHDANRTMLIGGIVLGILVAIGGALLARRITQPLKKLTSAATKMAGGDLSARVERLSEQTPAELDQLAEAFNEMAATIEHDVNELRRQEQLQRELVANVAHELATPLTAIQGFSEALADNVVQDEQERGEISRIINRETVRLRRLVDQLRQVARLEAGTEHMDLHPVQLTPLVNDTITVLQSESERRHVVIHNQIAATMPEVQADADRLMQVMLNLIDNALRHTPAGGSIAVAARQEGELVWVSVADTGIGIPAEDVPRIFERFFRSDPSRARATGGSGLGLAIVKGVIAAHHGQVRAESEVGKGTRISFSLHLASRPHATTPHQELAGVGRAKD